MANLSPELSRRKFMATTLGAVASASLAGLAPGLVRGDDQAPETAEENGIVYRTIGRTGLKVPVVSMGAGACNDPALVAACYESGMRLFDTAANYGYGRNEQMVAAAINRLKARDQVLMTTKCLTPAQRVGLSPEDTGPTIRSAFEGSLRRLRTDHVDVLFLHDVREPSPVHNEAIRDTMVALKKEGKTRAIGVATHADMANVINAAVEVEDYDVVLTSFNFTMADDTDMLAALANAHAKGVGIVAMKTQSGGANFPNPDTLRDYPATVINSAALKWVISNEAISTTIPGITTFDHLRANVAVASNLAYTEEESRFLNDNRITIGMGFCRQCSKCLASCPSGVDIPNLMRTHMYAAQYADFELARQTIDQIERNRNIRNCTDCANCVAECANAVNIPRKISELKLIYA